MRIVLSALLLPVAGFSLLLLVLAWLVAWSVYWLAARVDGRPQRMSFKDYLAILSECIE